MNRALILTAPGPKVAEVMNCVCEITGYDLAAARKILAGLPRPGGARLLQWPAADTAPESWYRRLRALGACVQLKLEKS